jgi:Wiskott-Aldrich syndrome protein
VVAKAAPDRPTAPAPVPKPVPTPPSVPPTTDDLGLDPGDPNYPRDTILDDGMLGLPIMSPRPPVMQPPIAPPVPPPPLAMRASQPELRRPAPEHLPILQPPPAPPVPPVLTVAPTSSPPARYAPPKPPPWAAATEDRKISTTRVLIFLVIIFLIGLVIGLFAC